MSDLSYARRVAGQIEQYKKEGSIRQTQPDAFFYIWNNYLAKRVQEIFSVQNHLEFYVSSFIEAMTCSGNRNILSIGPGEADLEVRIADQLVAAGLSDFTIHCLELSPILIARARQRVAEYGHSERFEFITSDVGEWMPKHKFGAYMANHSLHHIAPLEHLFSVCRSSLETGGCFLTCDVIGRNGHMRWPEAYELVRRLWLLLPEHQRRNNLSKQVWHEFVNRDVSSDGFEGIRAQDILPLLVKNFNFCGFMAYGGLTEVFSTVTFGPNFDMRNEWDRAFIDFVAFLNDVLIEAGYLTPTHMWAKLTVDDVAGGTRIYKHVSPEFCLKSLNWLGEFGRDVGHGSGAGPA